jgi:hypothetical protein
MMSNELINFGILHKRIEQNLMKLRRTQLTPHKVHIRARNQLKRKALSHLMKKLKESPFPIKNRSGCTYSIGNIIIKVPINPEYE